MRPSRSNQPTLLALLFAAAVLPPWTAASKEPKRPPVQTGAETTAADDGARKREKSTAAADSPAPTPKPGDWEAFVDPEGHIFPSLLLASATVSPPVRAKDTPPVAEKKGARKQPPAAKASATPVASPTPAVDAPEVLGDENGLLGVTVVSPGDGAHARVEIRENALMAASALEVDLPAKGRTYHLMPRVDYKYDALNRVRQSHPMNVAISLQLDGKDVGQQLVTARVHPINDCPYAYENPDDENDYVDISWMFAAYVNEDHPAIPGLLKEAQATGVVDGFDAYQSEDPGKVLLQVFAVWEALRQHDIKYSDIGTTTTESDSLYTLHVRFIEESLSESHANCVDASVMLASILRRMGLDSFLVLEPGHMFLGIYLDREAKQSICLETTMLGDPDPAKFVENRALAKVASKEVKALKGWKAFNDALDSATKEYHKHRKRFQKENDPEYEVIDIAGSRYEGIAPIGYVQPDGSVLTAPKN